MAQREVPESILERFRKVSTATVFTALWERGYQRVLMEEVYSLTPGRRMVGRARTLRFLPWRPDLAQEVRRGPDSPEYQAMQACGPGDVLVIDAMGMPYCAVGGDVKFLYLKMRRAEGLVTDGAIRDLEGVGAYGFGIFARRRTPGIGLPYGDPYQAGVDIQCGGVLVRPGDVIVADDDGVVVCPAHLAEEVVAWCEEHKQVEEWIKGLIQKENVPPGTYYPPTEATVRLFRERRTTMP
ncbi:MAG: ribonuclease activity regulator RraA [Dehalococcoidia bacterium]|nr:ribonuclease activity regulator RraA [Dehalococcoidia bacterium]MDW8119971.1 ribonuclease activity regulator RraA [Chloroflexota bacterium]